MAELELRGVRKSYGKKAVLRAASFSAESGACVGIVGENGSGKTTLLRIMAGILRPDAGSFLFRGEEQLGVKKRSGAVGFVPQGAPVVGELTALDNLRLWYGKRALEESLEGGVLRTLGVGDFLTVRADRLSGGMRKRLVIGCAMARGPQVMLLDEPTAALDLPAKAGVLRYFRDFSAGGGITVMATHDREELNLCSEVYVLTEGLLLPYAFDGDMDRLVGRLKGQ